MAKTTIIMMHDDTMRIYTRGLFVFLIFSCCDALVSMLNLHPCVVNSCTYFKMLSKPTLFIVSSSKLAFSKLKELASMYDSKTPARAGAFISGAALLYLLCEIWHLNIVNFKLLC